jgi:hypothetical protein
MTFDEAIEAMTHMPGNEIRHRGDLTYAMYRAYDVVKILEQLRHEYAPEIEMTERQRETLFRTFDQTVKNINHNETVTAAEYVADMPVTGTEINLPIKTAISLLVHPETIKIVEEVEK